MNKKPSVLKEAAFHTGNGVAAAISNFMRKHLVVVSSTERSQQPLLDFASRLTAEWADDPKIRATFPKEFDGSLYTQIYDVLDSTEMLSVLEALTEAKEQDNFEKLCRVIGYGETLIFLDKNKDKVIKLMEEIREGGKFIIPDKKLDL